MPRIVYGTFSPPHVNLVGLAADSRFSFAIWHDVRFSTNRSSFFFFSLSSSAPFSLVEKLGEFIQNLCESSLRLIKATIIVAFDKKQRKQLP